MSTTDHRAPVPPHAEATPHRADAVLASLDGVKRRKRLNALEAHRSHLAMIAAQQRSHDLDEAEETFHLQLGIETTIREEFPEDYEELLPTWFEREASAEHPRGVLTAECGICRSIAKAHGLNLLPPEAA